MCGDEDRITSSFTTPFFCVYTGLRCLATEKCIAYGQPGAHLFAAIGRAGFPREGRAGGLEPWKGNNAQKPATNNDTHGGGGIFSAGGGGGPPTGGKGGGGGVLVVCKKGTAPYRFHTTISPMAELIRRGRPAGERRCLDRARMKGRSVGTSDEGQKRTARSVAMGRLRIRCQPGQWAARLARRRDSVDPMAFALALLRPGSRPSGSIRGTVGPAGGYDP